MRRATLWSVLVALCGFGIAGCGSGSPLRVSITTAPTTLQTGATAAVTAIVTHDKAAGGVTWSCAPTGACGTFDQTQTPSGTPTNFTAPAVPPTGGSVTITATSVTKPSISGSATIAITAIQTQNFVFFATGEENTTFDLYSIAGVVAIATDGSGTVTGGEQDFNDGVGGLTSPPSGDMITGGSLVMANDGSGNGVLTLITDNANLGVAGTETFAVVFANTNHALIAQFDGSATSFGSMDLQTATVVPAGSLAFTASGIDAGGLLIDFGGVFAIDASGNVTGFFDENDGGTVTTNNPIPEGAAASVSDSFGRGVVTGATGANSSFNFYVVGPEVIRVIDVNTVSTAIGSAYGQGTSAGTFTSGSIGASVFSVANSADFYAGVGEFSTPVVAPAGKPGTHSPIPQGQPACSGNVTCSFSGVGDVNELASVLLPAQPFTGTFSISAAGNGFMTFTTGDFGDIATLGVYAVDPTLNILDPNDTSDSTGGALVAEMDGNLVGTGSIVPQSDTTVTAFSGPYAFGAQGDSDVANDEFDLVGAANVASDTGVFSGTGALSDPFGALTAGGESSANFVGTVAADGANLGRFTINPLTIVANGTTVNRNVTVYQASGLQLVWIEMDPHSYFNGSLEQSTAFTTTGAKRAQAKAKAKKH